MREQMTVSGQRYGGRAESGQRYGYDARGSIEGESGTVVFSSERPETVRNQQEYDEIEREVKQHLGEIKQMQTEEDDD